MKKSLQILIGSMIIAFVFNACGGGQTSQVKTESKEQDTAVKVQSTGGGADDMAIVAINKQAKGFYVDGFAGGTSTISKNRNLENMKKIVKLVKPLIDKLPDGYVMEITGHCAAYESEAERQRVSENRAKMVYEELKKAGAAADKMTYRGAGSDEPLSGVDPKSTKQRRVSFLAVKK